MTITNNLQPSVHGPAYWEETHTHPEIYTYLPLGPFPTLDAFLAHITPRWVPRPDQFVFAIYSKVSAPASASGQPPNGDGDTSEDTVQPYAFAGLCGYIKTNPTQLTTEIGYLIVLPAFQGTGITSAAVALLLQYALLLPTEGGLGLRRVQYQTDARNERWIGLARKCGFQLEGMMRWSMVVSEDKDGVEPREGEPKPRTKGRHTAVLVVCWDDWEQGLKEKVCRPGYVMYTA